MDLILHMVSGLARELLSSHHSSKRGLNQAKENRSQGKGRGAEVKLRPSGGQGLNVMFKNTASSNVTHKLDPEV